MATDLRAESVRIEGALAALGLDLHGVAPDQARPKRDARFDALGRWVDERLRQNGRLWRSDERLVVFTEYKTTLDYLQGRLLERYADAEAVQVLFGGMDETEREEIKAAFNDPRDPVRILVATDAASEGLNLQETARYLLHFDVPWNPARLEQRNGRLDRYGQARDVTVHHFATDDDADLAFLSYVVTKVDTIREDLGATGEVFDAAFQRRFIEGADEAAVRRDLDQTVAQVKGRASFPRDAAVATSDESPTTDEGRAEGARLMALAEELDLDPDALRDTLEVALGIRFGRPRFEPPDERGRVRLRHPIPPGWDVLIDDTLRLETRRGQKGALPALVFDPLYFLHRKGDRPVFRPERETALLHLAHPLFQRALASFAQLRFPGKETSATRWTLRRGHVPEGADAVVLLTVEELAVNDLRETFHHWVRTLRVPIRKRELGEPLPHEPAVRLRVAGPTEMAEVHRARELWDEVGPDVRRLVDDLAKGLTKNLRQVLEREREAAIGRERERFQSRQGELSALIEQQTLARLEREIEALEADRRQRKLFDPEDRVAELLRSEHAKKEELQRRRGHYEELRQQLARERERVTDHLIPKRYAMRGDAQVFPVAVEIRLPEERR